MQPCVTLEQLYELLPTCPTPTRIFRNSYGPETPPMLQPLLVFYLSLCFSLVSIPIYAFSHLPFKLVATRIAAIF